MAFAPAIGGYSYWCVVMFLCERAQTPNAITKRYQQTLPLMGATRPASGIKVKVHTPNKGSQAALIIRLSVRTFAFMPDARRVAPIRGSVWGFYHTTTTYTPSILHLTQTRCNSLAINTLLSVRCYQCHLHATCTTCTQPTQPTRPTCYHTTQAREGDITA